MPAALGVNWEEIKQYMMLSGATFEDAACKFSSDEEEVSHWAIRKRAEREQWPLPERVAKKAQELVQKIVQNNDLSDKSAQNWAQNGENHRALAFKVASKAMNSVAAAPPEVKDWSDVERIDKIARRAAGLDTTETTVQANVSFQMLGERFERPVEGVEVVGEVREIAEE